MTKRKGEGPERFNRRPPISFPCVICAKPRVMDKTEYDRKMREGYRPSTCGRKHAAEKRTMDAQARRVDGLQLTVNYKPRRAA